MWTPLRALALGLALTLILAPATPAAAQDQDVDIDVFYEELAPYGRWSEDPRWGPVWRPDVDDGWRPYTRGYWAHTEENGWYWASEEPWGWATDHYGRWFLDEDGLWAWIPGTEWAPAWVIWRYSEDHVGWAPLPPEADWDADGALAYDEGYYDDPRYAFVWSFIEPRYMTEPGLYRYLAPRPRAFILLRETRHFRGHRRFGPGRVFNPGFDVRLYERRVGRPAPRFRLRGVDNLRDHGAQRRPGTVDIPVFRPRITGLPKGEPRRLPPRFLDATPGKDVSPGKRAKGGPPGPQPQVKGPIGVSPPPGKDGPLVPPGGVKQGKGPAKLEPPPGKDGPPIPPGWPKQGKGPTKLEPPPQDKGPPGLQPSPYVKGAPPDQPFKGPPAYKGPPPSGPPSGEPRQFREKGPPPGPPPQAKTLPTPPPQAKTPPPRPPQAKDPQQGKPAAKKDDKDKKGPGQPN